MEKRIQKDSPTIISNKLPSEPLKTLDKPEIFGFSYATTYKKNNIKLPSLSETADFISEILSQMISKNCKKKSVFSIFNAKKKPKMTVKNYLSRICKYSRISFESLILGIIYIDRYINMKEDYFLSDFNVHKYFKKVIFCECGACCEV